MDPPLSLDQQRPFLLRVAETIMAMLGFNSSGGAAGAGPVVFARYLLFGDGSTGDHGNSIVGTSLLLAPPVIASAQRGSTPRRQGSVH
jgi:hypothetical protein